MPSRFTLPSSPDIRQPRNRAKDLLKAFRDSDPEAVARLRQALPELAGLSDPQVLDARLSLKDTQRAVAREYGFEDWAALKECIEQDSGAEIPEEMRDLARAIDAVDVHAVRSLLETHPDLGVSRDYPDRGRSLLVRAAPDPYTAETPESVK